MSLRATVLRGGTYLIARQVLSLMVHLGGVLALTRMIGPKSYGLYAAAVGIHTYLYYVTQFGLGVYLIRREVEPEPEEYDQAFSVLLLVGVLTATAASLAFPLINRWARLEGLAPVARTLFVVLPLQLSAIVPMARLERALDYRRVALSELFGYSSFYAAALPLAYYGAGAWAPVAGFWTQQVLTFSLYTFNSGYRPTLRWKPPLVRQMLRYGVGYASAFWVWQLRELVNPLVVGRYAGVAAVGYVAFTVRMVEALSFAKMAAWRLSMAVLARLQADRQKLVEAVSEGMRLQVLASGPVFVAFGLVAPVVIARLFGDRWTPTTTVYPFIALGYLTNAVFSLHSSALFVVKRNWQVGLFHAVHLVLFAGSALLLVPRLGLLGYGWSEVVALLSYAVLHDRVARYIGVPRYDFVGLWWAAWASLLFWQRLGWWSLVGPVVALAWPGAAQQLRRYIVNVAGVIHAR